MSSCDMISTGCNLIDVSYGGGGVSDTEHRNSGSSHPVTTSRDHRGCVTRVEMLNDPDTIVMDW